MSYLLLLRRDVNRRDLIGILAEMFSLPASEVDVGGDGAGDRNWGAPISCTVADLGDDMPLQLDIYFTESLPAPPEEQAAAWLAARLHTLVAYEAVSLPPGHWLVGPDGRRTRARFDEYDEDGIELTGYRIVATERPLPELPGVSVTPIPEVIREYRMPTPMSDALDAAMQSPTDSASPVWHFTRGLEAWEAMVARLAAGWHPDGWYPADYYREDLETRDELAQAAAAMPQPVRTGFKDALKEIDRRFLEATVDDGGQALAAVTGPVPDRWWWHRITDPTPWHRMPGATT